MTDRQAKAASLKGESRLSQNPRPAGEVWVVVEQEKGIAARVSWELLGEAASLADQLGSRPAAVIFGEGSEGLAQEAFAYGAQAVYVADDPALTPFTTDPHCRCLAGLASSYAPAVILLGATTRGRDVASAAATELETGLTADCTQLDIDEKWNLLQTRPAFGGNILATIYTTDHTPQMSTVRPGVFSLPERKAGAQGEIIRYEPGLREADLPVRQIEFVPTAGEEVSLQGAAVIIAGGRGMGSGKNFKLLEELAAELGGVVAGSRAAVDAGWISHQRQVGQTGQTVRPVLYVAVGISGAIQHLAGMQNSDIIVAINSDPDAPIFEVADYGIAGDFNEVVPALIEEARKRKTAAGTAAGLIVSGAAAEDKNRSAT